MADEKEVQEQTIADELVLKKYKEAGEITNSWVETFTRKIPRVKATIQFAFLSITELTLVDCFYVRWKYKRLSIDYSVKSRYTFR